MFGFRKDGKKVKGMNIIDKAEPFFMPQRIDAVNYITVKVPCDPMDDFIARERKNGNKYTYMHIMLATLVRILYVRKKMNRFIIRGSVYQRNEITISMDVKKKLEDDGEQMTLKFHFTGRESLPQVFKIVDDEINKNLAKDNVDNTTKVAGKLVKCPDWMFRWTMAIFRWMDRHGLLTKGLINASPFHTSIFFSNLKSIKLGYIYHHLYNFGTTSIFITMGKEKMEPVVVDNKELKVGKVLTFGMSLDERIADGLYMGKTLRIIQDFLANPDALMTEMPDDGSIPKKVVKKRGKKAPKVKKVKKEKKVKEKKIKNLKNKKRHDEKLEKARLRKEKKLQEKLAKGEK